MNKKLYIGNLPPAAEEPQLQALFGADGRKVLTISIITDRKTGRSRGFAFIEMATEADAQKAIDALHGHELMGRALSVSEAREPRENEDRDSFVDRNGSRHFLGECAPKKRGT